MKLILAFALIGFAVTGSAGDVVDPMSFYLEFSNEVPPTQREHLTKDIQTLKEMQINSAPPGLGKVMDLEGPVTNAALLQWLSERVRYVVLTSYKTTEFTRFLMKSNHEFENPGLFPINPEDKVSEMKTPIEARASNYGLKFYGSSKMHKQLWKLRIPGISKDFVIDSPRVGIIAIGPAMFKPGQTNEQESDIVRRIDRLTTLFHEGRHSDGNGLTLGMIHDFCPYGHSYAGAPACDFSLNGPYSVGAHVTKTLGEACEHCSPEQKELIRLIALDSESRVVTEQVIYTEHDKWQMENLKKIRAICVLDKQSLKPVRLSSVCENIDQKLADATVEARSRAKIIPSVFLDSRPEGVK